MPYYIQSDRLYYELVISKAKGKRTAKLEEMMILIATNTIRKKQGNYRTTDDRDDCMQEGLLHLFLNWKNFDERKFPYNIFPGASFSYLTEIYKRGLGAGYNSITEKRSYNDARINISIDAMNEGNGAHFI